MAKNIKFGRLVNNVLEYADNPLEDNGQMIINPSREVYLRHGFKEIIKSYPQHREGYHFVHDGFTETSTQIIFKFKYVENAPVDPPPEPEEPEEQDTVRIFSKLYLKITLMKMGYWDKVVYWMQNNEIDLGGGVKLNCLEAFETAITLSDKFEGFSTIVKAIQNYLEVSDEVVEAILRNSLTD